MLLLCGWLSLGEFISGKSAFWHDSLQGFSFQHLCFEKLLSGRLPLWMPELNAGQPLWPLTETLACYDPVALLLWPVGALSGFSSMVIFEAVCIVWLILFAFGGLLLSRLLLRNWWINLAVFALLFGGPVGLGHAHAVELSVPVPLHAVCPAGAYPRHRRAVSAQCRGAGAGGGAVHRQGIRPTMRPGSCWCFRSSISGHAISRRARRFPALW